jgi:hypothetical protein
VTMTDKMAMYSRKVYEIGKLQGRQTTPPTSYSLVNGVYFNGYPTFNLGPPNRIKIGIGNKIRLFIQINIADYSIFSGGLFSYWGIAPIWSFVENYWSPPVQPVFNRSVEPDPPDISAVFLEQARFNDANITEAVPGLNICTRQLNWSVLTLPTNEDSYLGQGTKVSGEPQLLSVPLIAAADYADWQLVIAQGAMAPLINFAATDFVALWLMVGADAQ